MVKTLLISGAILLIVGGVAGVSIMYAQRQATELPENNLAAYLAAGPSVDDRPIIVFAGDSLTLGTVSASYLDILAARPGMDSYYFINAGDNSRLAYNIVLELDEIIACKPDIVSVLIGTNDVNSLMSPESQQRFIEDWNLPQVPDAEWFRENLTQIAKSLTSLENTRVAFLSLPTVGEDPDHPAFAMGRKYSGIIREIAEEFGIVYLPLHETMEEYLKTNPGSTKHDFSKKRSLMMKNVLSRYIFKRSFDTIAEKNGFSIHADHLHLSEAGAAMVADLLEPFILADR
ncbi:MAG: SGNH/GDSL hydrolase family protein [Spirochaetales bacterium]|jgi:acyl-CoA thioesterase I|nr:SGNH/GDSL hydrolase family protein [Spirochaetales bacterium]